MVSLHEFAWKLPKFTRRFTAEYQPELWRVPGLIENTVYQDLVCLRQPTTGFHSKAIINKHELKLHPGKKINKKNGNERLQAHL